MTIEHNDIVVCINNDDTDLIIGKRYIVNNVDCENYCIYITLVDCEYNYYCMERFELLQELRQNKINKIMK